MKRVIPVVMAIGLALGVAGPAYALDPLIDSRFRDVRLKDNGSVRMEVEYKCPGRRGYEADAAGIVAYHIQSSGAYVTDAFRDAIVCDGRMHTFVRRLAPPTGEVWDPKLLLQVGLTLSVRAGSDPDARTLLTREIDTFVLHREERAKRPGDIHITGARVNDAGALVVAMSYRCPRGWFVDVEDDDDWATLTGAIQAG